MKQVFLMRFALLAFALLTSVVLPAQQSSPPWFVVFEEHVSPADRAQFMKVQKEAVELWKTHQLDIPVYAYQNDDNALYWVIPIRNFASIDTLYKKMGEFSEKTKAAGYDGDAKFRDLSTISTTVIRWDPELSYHPNDVFMSPGKPYMEWMFINLRSGHEKEMADAIKKYIDFYSKNNIDNPWDTFHVMMGNDNPAMIIMFRAESPVTMRTLDAQIYEQHGEELNNLWNNAIMHARKIENKTGWEMPSFSYMPGE